MHVAAEEVQFLLPVVPAVVGAEHFVLLPHIRSKAEVGGGKVTPVLQAGGFHEGGVHIHVHLVVEHKQAGLGIIGAVQALYHLPVLVPHGCTVLEHGHGVLGVVVQVAGAQGVLLLVFQLHQVTAELGHVLVHHVLQGFTGKLGLVLDDTHVPHGVYDVGAHVPQGGVAKQIGIVMEELGRAHHFAEFLAVLFDELGALGADELHFVLAP